MSELWLAHGCRRQFFRESSPRQYLVHPTTSKYDKFFPASLLLLLSSVGTEDTEFPLRHYPFGEVLRILSQAKFIGKVEVEENPTQAQCILRLSAYLSQIALWHIVIQPCASKAGAEQSGCGAKQDSGAVVCLVANCWVVTSRSQMKEKQPQCCDPSSFLPEMLVAVHMVSVAMLYHLSGEHRLSLSVVVMLYNNKQLWNLAH